MTKLPDTELSDTELMLLSAASQRGDLAVELPPRLGAEQAEIAISKLLRDRLIVEIYAEGGLPIWRHDDVDVPKALVISDIGLSVIGLDATEFSGVTKAGQRTVNSAPSATSGQGERTSLRLLRESYRHAKTETKLSRLIQLLCLDGGVTIDDLIAEFGWLPHSARASISRLRKRGFAVERTSDVAGNLRYRLGSKVALQQWLGADDRPTPAVEKKRQDNSEPAVDVTVTFATARGAQRSALANTSPARVDYVPRAIPVRDVPKHSREPHKSNLSAKSELTRAQDSEEAEPESPIKANVDQRLSDQSLRFVEFMRATGGWTGQTAAQSAATYRMFIGHCGDRIPNNYTRRDLASFFDVLRRLPALYAKKPCWDGLTLREITESALPTDTPQLSMMTVKRHFSALSKLFEDLKSRGDFEDDNPAYGFKFQTGGRKARARDARHMWEGEQLRALFASPVWTGCLSSSRRACPGKLIIKDEKYWLPLLGLYHGNRLEEFAQLRQCDIREEDGIWFFDINHCGSNQLKNAQSARQVPIHSRLVGYGFLDYLKEMALPPDGRVFPLLQPGGPDRKLGFYFTKWWTQYRRNIGVYSKGLDYHSFRHGVTTKLFAADVPEAIVDALTGHEALGTSRKVYLKRLPLVRLAAAVEAVRWDEIEYIL